MKLVYRVTNQSDPSIPRAPIDRAPATQEFLGFARSEDAALELVDELIRAHGIRPDEGVGFAIVDAVGVDFDFTLTAGGE